jgi:glycerophosphoryl diester phosphodiesterase
MGLNLEIKPTAGWEEPAATAMSAVIKEHWQADAPLLLSSFNERCLAVLRHELPGVPRGYLTGIVPPDWRHRMLATECSTLHLNAGLLGEDSPLEEIKRAGYRVLCYTVNEEVEARRLYSLGVDGVFTDFPERFPREPAPPREPVR